MMNATVAAINPIAINAADAIIRMFTVETSIIGLSGVTYP